MAARLRVRCKPSKLEIQISRCRSFAGEACVQTKGGIRPSLSATATGDRRSRHVKQHGEAGAKGFTPSNAARVLRVAGAGAALSTPTQQSPGEALRKRNAQCAGVSLPGYGPDARLRGASSCMNSSAHIRSPEITPHRPGGERPPVLPPGRVAGPVRRGLGGAPVGAASARRGGCR
jgi:hypothetical protein